MVDENVIIEVPLPPEDSATLAGLTETVNPEEGDTQAQRLTDPVKLFRLARLMVDDAELPVENETLVGFAEREKSPTLTVTVVAWDKVPLTPVTVTVYVPPVVALNEHVELAEPPDATETLPGPQDRVRPVVGLTEVVSPTEPENPPKLVAVIIDEPFDPSWNVTVAGLADIAKSATFTVT